MKKQVLVTGGAGFLGSHLCERLLEDDERVVCVDNLSTGRAGNIRHLLVEDRFTFIEQDILTPLVVETDRIYHLACPASPRSYQQDPVATIKTSVLGTLNVLELAVSQKARVLFASTSEVYGDPLISPQREDYRGNVNPIGPRACYDEGKRCAETLLADHIRHLGLDARIARLFNTYGPRMLPDDGRVVSNFVVQALSGQDITVYGTGRQRRSFCFVDDTIEALVRIMRRSAPFVGPVNIGNPVECTIRALADLIIDLTGTTSKLAFLPLPEDDPKRRQPDIAKARRLLDWEPRISMESGMMRTIAYFERALSAGNSTQRARHP